MLPTFVFIKKALLATFSCQKKPSSVFAAWCYNVYSIHYISFLETWATGFFCIIKQIVSSCWLADWCRCPAVKTEQYKIGLDINSFS